MDTPTQWNFFKGFNVEYQNMSIYGILFELELETITQEEKETVIVKLSEFPPVLLGHLK